MSNISTQSSSPAHFDRFVVIHVATTCDEHGVYVTKDSAEVIELGWILLEAKSLEEVCVEKKNNQNESNVPGTFFLPPPFPPFSPFIFIAASLDYAILLVDQHFFFLWI